MVAVSFGALSLASALLAARIMPESRRLERACGTAVLLPALAIGIVYALGAVGAIATLPWLAACLLVALGALAVGGTAGWAVLWSDVVALRRLAREIVRDAVAMAALGTALLAVALAMLSVWLLVPWAWDSLGYHLPIVHDALQTGTLRRVPTSVAYVNCYPRLVDVFFVGWRLSLLDETWVELGQLPFALGGVVAIAALAERGGAGSGRALALAALWLAVPVTMLELATAYVDVAVAALCLLALTLSTASPRGGTPLVAGVAIGLLLGSKPSAPPIAAVAIAALLWRSVRMRRGLRGLLGAATALAIGSWKYVENLREHHNPIWPAELALGPIRFGGKATMAELATSGLREPYLSMGWLERLIASWTALPDRYVFDMRIGGFGPLFTFMLLPLALAAPIAAARSAALRRRLRPLALPVVLIIGATLASPGAHWARYTLAVPGALLALGIAVGAALPDRPRARAEIAGIALSAAGIALGWRGFTEGGPSLFEIAAMAPEARLSAHALDAQERDWQAARERVGPGEAFGYDWSYGLPGRLWRHDGRGRVAFLEQTTPTLDELLAWVRRERVRVVVLGEGPTGDADLARAHPEHFRELFRSAYPEWQPCAVFEVLGRPPGSVGRPRAEP